MYLKDNQIIYILRHRISSKKSCYINYMYAENWKVIWITFIAKTLINVFPCHLICPKKKDFCLTYIYFFYVILRTFCMEHVCKLFWIYEQSPFYQANMNVYIYFPFPFYLTFDLDLLVQSLWKNMYYPWQLGEDMVNLLEENWNIDLYIYIYIGTYI